MFTLLILGKDGSKRARTWSRHLEAQEHCRALAVENIIDQDEFIRCIGELEDQRVKLNAAHTPFNQTAGRF